MIKAKTYSSFIIDKQPKLVKYCFFVENQLMTVNGYEKSNPLIGRHEYTDSHGLESFNFNSFDIGEHWAFEGEWYLLKSS